MSPLQSLSHSRLVETLNDAIRRQCRISVTHHGARGWCVLKSKFVAGSPEAGRLDITIPFSDEEAASPELRVGDSLGVTFRTGHKKCMFSTSIQAAGNTDGVEAMALRWPAEIQQLQRRAYERAVPPPGTVVAVRFWQETAESRGGTDDRHVRHGQLEDLSAGGMRVRVANPAGIEPGDTYRCVFTPRPGKFAVIVNAFVRHREVGDKDRASIGFQFIGMETSEDGRRALDHIARTISQYRRTH